MIRVRLPDTPATVAAAAGYVLSYLLAGFFCATPLVSLVATTTGHLDGGDALLFEPGGVFLIEHVRMNAPAILATARTTAVQFAVASILLLYPLATITVAINFPSLRIRLLPAEVLRHLPSFVLLGALSLLARFVVTSLVILLGGALMSVIGSSLGEKSSDGLLAIAFLLLLLIHGVISVCFDFARNAAVARSLSVLRSLPIALECLLRRPSAHLSFRLLTALLGWGAPLLVATSVGRLDGGESDAWRLLLVALAHQCAVLCLLLGRYWWLSYAAEAVQSLPGEVSLDQLGGKAEQTDVPDVPSPDPDASPGA